VTNIVVKGLSADGFIPYQIGNHWQQGNQRQI
jgi:hypothetical protein